MSVTYVLLKIEDEKQADDLLLDLARVPSGYVLTPFMENEVGVEVVRASRDGARYTPPPECERCGELVRGEVCITCGRAPGNAGEGE